MSYRLRPDDELFFNSSCYDSDMSRDAGSGYSATGNGSKASGPYQRPPKLPSFNLDDIHREFNGTSEPGTYHSDMWRDPGSVNSAAGHETEPSGPYQKPPRLPSFDVDHIRREFNESSGDNGTAFRSNDGGDSGASNCGAPVNDPYRGRKLWWEYCERTEAEEAVLKRNFNRLSGGHSSANDSGSCSVDGVTHSNSITRKVLERPLQEERDWSGRFKESRNQPVMRSKGRGRRFGSTWKLGKTLPAAKLALTDDECRKYYKGLKVVKGAAAVGGFFEGLTGFC